MHTDKALLLGFFSTIGDLECLDIVKGWLDKESLAYDLSCYIPDIIPALEGSLPLDTVKPKDYTHLIIICGPCWRSLFAEMGININEYNHCYRIGVNLTMVEPLDQWNPFDILLERDSSEASRPDLSLLKPTVSVPVVGLCYVEEQSEYGNRDRHSTVFQMVEKFLDKRNIAAVKIDTRWPYFHNKTGLYNPEQVTSLMSKLDVIITNRLHGTVFAMKAGTPPLVIDGIDGGDKVSKQAKTLDWPAVDKVENLTEERLEEMFDWCLSNEAKDLLKKKREEAYAAVVLIEDEFTAALKLKKPPSILPPNTPTPESIKRSLASRAIGKVKRKVLSLYKG